MVSLALVLAAPLSAAAFLNPETPEVRLRAALEARDLRPQLAALKSGRVDARAEPDRRLAVRMVGAMVAPPTDWRRWIDQTERENAARPLSFGELRATLGHALASRVRRPESLAYQLGMSTDGASREFQIGYAQTLMKERGVRFWPNARAGLPVLNPTMRARAGETIGAAIGRDSEVIAPGHLALARKWLAPGDLSNVRKAYRFWSSR